MRLLKWVLILVGLFIAFPGVIKLLYGGGNEIAVTLALLIVGLALVVGGLLMGGKSAAKTSVTHPGKKTTM